MKKNQQDAGRLIATSFQELYLTGRHLQLMTRKDQHWNTFCDRNGVSIDITCKAYQLGVGDGRPWRCFYFAVNAAVTMLPQTFRGRFISQLRQFSEHIVCST
jgi:hypothetical protein